MGKDTGFLKYDRKEPGYRPVEERLEDYKAVECRMDENDIHEQAARCMDCGIPFCHGYGCPVSNIIPEMNDLVYRGQWREALDILLSTNNFPEFTGRLCPAPCETACVAGIHAGPVSIRQLELSVIEKGFEDGLIRPVPPASYFDERIAVIGSGPSGLAAADTLNKAGYAVTVYEHAEKPGGLLRYGVPEFKLEKWIVDRRIDLMREEGVRFETGVRVGTDISYRYLSRHFDAICLACGSHQPRDLSIPGRNLAGIFFAMEFLTQQNKRIGGERVDPSEAISAKDKAVIIIGGGDTGSDCLGTSLRQGAKSVIQLEILSRPPVERPAQTPWPMWPLVLRKSHAHKEGGERRFSTITKTFLGENQVVKKLLCAEVEWVTENADAPPQPKEISGTDFELEADLVLLAMGFWAPGNERLIQDIGAVLDDRGHVKADENQMTSVNNVFVAGDMTTGQSLVVRAISSGRKTGRRIVSFLEGKRRQRFEKVVSTHMHSNHHEV